MFISTQWHTRLSKLDLLFAPFLDVFGIFLLFVGCLGLVFFLATPSLASTSLGFPPSSGSVYCAPRKRGVSWTCWGIAVTTKNTETVYQFHSQAD
jgi:hypothetical protein